MSENPEHAFKGRHSMLSLIELIYSGVGKDEDWLGILDSLNESVGAEMTLILSPMVGTGVAVSGRMPEKLVEDFLGYYAGVNVLTAPCDLMFSPGEVRYSHWALADSEFERSEFYNDFFQHHKVFYSMGLKVPLGIGSEAYLSCARPKSRGPFDEMEGLVYATLLPHLQRALKLHQQMGQLQVRSLGLETALEAHDHAVLGLNVKGQIVICNSQARALLQTGTGVRLRHGQLGCTRTEDTRTLRTMIASVLAGGVGGAMLVHRPNMAALRVTVGRFAADMPGQGMAPSVLVYLSDPNQTLPSRAETMRGLYGLTPTEGRIADLLMAGLEIREVAEQMRITLETARFHVKRVLTKTGARRQSGLMRLMLALPGNEGK